MLWPSIIYVILTLIGLGSICANHGKYEKVNAYSSIFAVIICWYILYKGGFFNNLINRLFY